MLTGMLVLDEEPTVGHDLVAWVRRAPFGCQALVLTQDVLALRIGCSKELIQR